MRCEKILVHLGFGVIGDVLQAQEKQICCCFTRLRTAPLFQLNPSREKEKNIGQRKMAGRKLGARRARGKRARLAPKFCPAIFRSPMCFFFSRDGLSWKRGAARSLLFYGIVCPRVTFITHINCCCQGNFIDK